MAGDKITILIVEDEPSIVQLIMFSLKDSGWHTRAVNTAGQAWDALQQETPQLVLLDWMLPDQSGLKLLARIRADRNIGQLPVIMLTAKSLEEDKIAGLDQGADDYITKPFSPRELSSRIRALLRRKSPEHVVAILRAGPVKLDPVACVVEVNGERIDIGQTEFRLLKFLMANPERVYSRGQLLDRVWGDHAVIEERTIDVHVLRLRKALKEAGFLIRTVRSVGYALSEK